jgi:hypothetical protein
VWTFRRLRSCGRTAGEAGGEAAKAVGCSAVIGSLRAPAEPPSKPLSKNGLRTPSPIVALQLCVESNGFDRGRDAAS